MVVIKYKIIKLSHEEKMPAPLRIKLNPEEEDTLAELRQTQLVPYRTRDQSEFRIQNSEFRNAVKTKTQL